MNLKLIHMLCIECRLLKVHKESWPQDLKSVTTVFAQTAPVCGHMALATLAFVDDMQPDTQLRLPLHVVEH